MPTTGSNGTRQPICPSSARDRITATVTPPVRLATTIQITPGGVGVVEVLLVSGLVLVTGEAFQDEVVAAVVLYRVATYLAPIVIGGVCYAGYRLTGSRSRKVAAGEMAAAGFANETETAGSG